MRRSALFCRLADQRLPIDHSADSGHILLSAHCFRPGGLCLSHSLRVERGALLVFEQIFSTDERDLGHPVCRTLFNKCRRIRSSIDRKVRKNRIKGRRKTFQASESVRQPYLAVHNARTADGYASGIVFPRRGSRICSDVRIDSLFPDMCHRHDGENTIGSFGEETLPHLIRGSV